MLLNNKYSKCYFSIISNAKQKSRTKREGYFERHHIIPKCSPFNGNNSNDNLVLLTPKEHYICHLLLIRMCERGSIHRQKMLFAYNSFRIHTKNHGTRYFNSSMYDYIRKEHSECLKGDNNPAKKLGVMDHLKGDNNPSRRPDVIEKIRISSKLAQINGGHFTGLEHSKETKSKMSSTAKKREKKQCPHCDRIIAINGYASHTNSCITKKISRI
jgi:hypothetical protein